MRASSSGSSSGSLLDTSACMLDGLDDVIDDLACDLFTLFECMTLARLGFMLEACAVVLDVFATMLLDAFAFVLFNDFAFMHFNVFAFMLNDDAFMHVDFRLFNVVAVFLDDFVFVGAFASFLNAVAFLIRWAVQINQTRIRADASHMQM